LLQSSKQIRQGSFGNGGGDPRKTWVKPALAFPLDRRLVQKMKPVIENSPRAPDRLAEPQAQARLGNSRKIRYAGCVELGGSNIETLATDERQPPVRGVH
jgi:hypothetical protein